MHHATLQARPAADSMRATRLRRRTAVVTPLHQRAAPDRRRARRLAAVSALRLVAATWMVGYHLSVTGLLDGFALPLAIRHVLHGGSALTGMFLMLSGFMMSYAYADADGRLKASAVDIWIGRVARLWPIMIVAHLLAVPFALLGRDVYEPGEAIARAVLALFALQAWVPLWAFSYNGPAWTISVLALCYALFPWLAGVMRRRSQGQLVGIVVACWVAMLVPTALHFTRLDTGLTALSNAPNSLAEAVLHAFPPLRLPEFVAGMALARLFTMRGCPRSGTLASAGAVAFAAAIAILAISPDLPERFVANGLLSPLFWVVLVGAASAPTAIDARLQRLRVTTLGDASLGMFVLHMPLVLALAAAARMQLLPAVVLHACVAAFVPGMLVLSVIGEARFVKPSARYLQVALQRMLPGTPVRPIDAGTRSPDAVTAHPLHAPPPSVAAIERGSTAA